MKKVFIALVVLLLVSAVLWLVGCSKEDSSAVSPATGVAGAMNSATGKSTSPSSVNAGHTPTGSATPCNGTTLGATFDPTTATCFNYYQWSCDKTMDAGPFRLCPNECQDVIATVTVTKGGTVSGFTGKICVTNGGSVETENLKVGVSLESKANGPGQFAATGLTATGLEGQHPVLAPGATYCYTYTISAPIDTSLSYRVSSDGFVTITNHSGSGFTCGTPQGPNEKTVSAKGCGPSNDCFDVTDTPGTPVNSLNVADATSWTITSSTTDNTHLCASGTVHFTLTICNVAGANDETWSVTNTASVGTGDGSHTCSAPFGLSTVGCRTNNGCSLTQGYWKTHGCVGPNGGGQYGNNPDRITPLLGSCGPITLGAKAISTCGEAGGVFQGVEHNGGNAILRLYSQLLAARLNICNGADGSCIGATLFSADSVLTAADPNGDGGGWSNITGANRSKVLSTAGTLDQYNNGLLCVPHCE